MKKYLDDSGLGYFWGKLKTLLGALAWKTSVGTADIDNGAVTSARLADMAAYTVKGRNASSVGAPSDVTMLDVAEYAIFQGTTATSIADAELMPITVSETSLKKITWANVKAALATAFAGLDGNDKIKPEQASSSIVTITTNTTLALTHVGKGLKANSSSAIVITIPTNASVAFPVETEFEVFRYGAGAVSFSAASGVTIRSVDAKLGLNKQYSATALKKLDTNEWLLIGDLA